MSNKKIPINRMGRFFDESDFNFEIEMGMEFLDDINIVVVLYKVNREFTQHDALYGETNKNEINFLPPIEIKCRVKIDEPNNKNINTNGTLKYLEPGNLTVTIYNKELKDKEIDIDYGDYIGYMINEDKMVYYTVINDGKINYNNNKTIGGYKSAFRKIICTPVTESEFNG